MNKQYGSLCNPSIAITANLFGDDLNKEVEELTKSNKLSSKVTSKSHSDYRFQPYKASSSKGTRGRGRYYQAVGRGRARSFLGGGRGQTRPPPIHSDQQPTEQESLGQQRYGSILFPLLLLINLPFPEGA